MINLLRRKGICGVSLAGYSLEQLKKRTEGKQQAAGLSPQYDTIRYDDAGLDLSGLTRCELVADWRHPRLAGNSTIHRVCMGRCHLRTTGGWQCWDPPVAFRAFDEGMPLYRTTLHFNTVACNHAAASTPQSIAGGCSQSVHSSRTTGSGCCMHCTCIIHQHHVHRAMARVQDEGA
jgi:hypothetical protein